MRINANGISINTQIDGPESAPWLVLSNSLMTNLSMWDDQVAELKQSLPHPALRPARPWRHAGDRGPLQLRPSGRRRGGAARRARDQARAFRRSVHGRHDGPVPGAAPSAALRSHHRLRLRARLHAGFGAAVAGAHRDRRQGRHGGPGRAHHRALVPARFRRRQAAGARQGAPDDPQHADCRLFGLRAGVVGL